MKNNLKKLAMMTVAMAMVALSPMASRALAASIEIPTTTFGISMLGDFVLVAKEGVPQTIMVRGRDLTGTGVSFMIDGTSYLGDVMETNNLTLIAGGFPLMFDHNGVVEFTAGANKLVLEYHGQVTKVRDEATLTQNLNSHGAFVIADGLGAFAALKGVEGTYTLTLMSRITPAVHPRVGSPVDVSFSAMSP